MVIDSIQISFCIIWRLAHAFEGRSTALGRNRTRFKDLFVDEKNIILYT